MNTRLRHRVNYAGASFALFSDPLRGKKYTKAVGGDTPYIG